ncbi:MAG: helix-turn-helix transcriptional regulator [Chryseolinea sp.]
MRNRDKRIQIAFGALIKRIRLERKWSQADLAAAVNMESNAISRLENGVIAPNVNTIVALALALGKHPSELLKLDLKFEINTDFTARHKNGKPSETTHVIRILLLETDFFNIARSVSDVIIQCKKQYKVILKSPATSGVLSKLREERKLKRTPSHVRGRYLYHS